MGHHETLGFLKRIPLLDSELPLMCCSNPKLIQIEYSTGKWSPTGYLFIDYGARRYSPPECQKCMKRFIYQQYGFHVDLSKLKSLTVWKSLLIEQTNWAIDLIRDDQEEDCFDEVTTFAEALRLLETNQA